MVCSLLLYYLTFLVCMFLFFLLVLLVLLIFNYFRIWWLIVEARANNAETCGLTSSIHLLEYIHIHLLLN